MQFVPRIECLESRELPAPVSIPHTWGRAGIERRHHKPKPAIVQPAPLLPLIELAPVFVGELTEKPADPDGPGPLHYHNPRLGVNFTWEWTKPDGTKEIVMRIGYDPKTGTLNVCEVYRDLDQCFGGTIQQYMTRYFSAEWVLHDGTRGVAGSAPGSRDPA